MALLFNSALVFPNTNRFFPHPSPPLFFGSPPFFSPLSPDPKRLPWSPHCPPPFGFQFLFIFPFSLLKPQKFLISSHNPTLLFHTSSLYFLLYFPPPIYCVKPQVWWTHNLPPPFSLMTFLSKKCPCFSFLPPLRYFWFCAFTFSSTLTGFDDFYNPPPVLFGAQRVCTFPFPPSSLCSFQFVTSRPLVPCLPL